VNLPDAEPWDVIADEKLPSIAHAIGIDRRTLFDDGRTAVLERRPSHSNAMWRQVVVREQLVAVIQEHEVPRSEFWSPRKRSPLRIERAVRVVFARFERPRARDSDACVEAVRLGADVVVCHFQFVGDGFSATHVELCSRQPNELEEKPVRRRL
jgi:hypothetical protein